MIIVMPVANEKRNQPILEPGAAGAITKRYSRPKMIAAKTPIAPKIRNVRILFSGISEETDADAAAGAAGVDEVLFSSVAIY
jgi:hypothetical protein